MKASSLVTPFGVTAFEMKSKTWNIMFPFCSFKKIGQFKIVSLFSYHDYFFIL